MNLEPWGDQALATSVKKLIACLGALGMNPSPYRGTEERLTVFGKREDLRMAAEVNYKYGLSPKGAPSAKFEYARVFDPVGIVTNLEFDYTIGPKQRKEQGFSEEHARKLSNQRNAEYNDGAQATLNKYMFTTSTAMNEWLDDWLDLLKIDHKKQSPKKRVAPTDLDLMMGSEWRG